MIVVNNWVDFTSIEDLRMTLEKRLLAVYQTLTSGTPVDRLIDVVRTHFGNPVAVCTCDMQTNAISTEEELKDDTWEMLVSSQMESYLQGEQKISRFKKNTHQQSDGTAYLCEGEELAHRILWRELSWRGKIIGNMFFLEYYHDFSEDDLKYANDVADAITYTLAFQMNLKSVQEPNAEIVLLDLIKGIRVPEEPICKYLLQKKNPGNLVIAVAELDKESDSPRLLERLKDTMLREIPGTVAVHYEGRIVFGLKNNHQIDWREFDKIVEESGCVAGVCNPFMSYDKTSLYYRQALQTLEFGKRYFIKNKVYHFFDMAPLYLLGQTDVKANVEQFMHPAMMSVMEYDEKHGTNWLASLYTFIYFNGDMRRTAEILNVSKSSMHYRINKIQEIVGHGLTSSYFIFHMRWSFNILYFMTGDAFYEKFNLPKELPLFPRYDHIPYDDITVQKYEY